MTVNRTDSKGDTALVVGFNARPIVFSAKRMGLKVLAVDYWGDIDLVRSVDDIEAVLKQTAGERPREQLSRPTCELLVEGAKRISQRHVSEVDFVLIGSGLDDRPDLWKELARIGPVFGNPVETVRKVRDRFRLYKTASRLGIPAPVTLQVSSLQELLRSAETIGYPVVLKPMEGGGGLGIQLAKDKSELEDQYTNEMKPKFGGTIIVQEYIRGENVSASVLGDGSKCTAVSVNEQLIGLKELGARAPFVWCGNVVPLDLSNKGMKAKAIACAAQSLGEELKLVGSNGFDFVLRAVDNKPVLIECNPRFQGTLECVELATGMNLVSEHVKVFRDGMSSTIPSAIRYATKMIPFAKERCVLGDLGGVVGVGDISPEGAILERGDPICTVHRTGRSKNEASKRAMESVGEIYKRVTVMITR
ncbi:MAG: ATP-grasp domain-containing protein [Candidatus Atabeyarchaeum deiterrae]